MWAYSWRYCPLWSNARSIACRCRTCSGTPKACISPHRGIRCSWWCRRWDWNPIATPPPLCCRHWPMHAGPGLRMPLCKAISVRSPSSWGAIHWLMQMLCMILWRICCPALFSRVKRSQRSRLMKIMVRRRNLGRPWYLMAPWSVPRDLAPQY